MKSNNPVDAKYLRESARITEALKLKSYERMQIKAGDHVLDAGCGVGVDTVRLVDLVGAEGKVVGIDADHTMLEEAEKTIAGHPLYANICHEIGDVLDLKYEEGVFDAVRAERLLQVVPKEYEKRIVSELSRVLKPGGRLVLSDTDWASASLALGNDELERRALRFFAESMRPNGYAGRTMYGLMAEASLKDLKVDVFPLVAHVTALTPFGGEWFFNGLLEAKIASPEEVEFWKMRLDELEKNGSLFSTVNMVIVSGTK